MTMFEFFNQDAIREQRNNAAVKVQAAARRFLAVRREAGRAAAAAVIQRSVRERQGLMRKDTEEVPCKEARAAAADLDEDELAALALPHVKRQFVLLVLIALVGLVVGGGASLASPPTAIVPPRMPKSSPMMVSKRSTAPPSGPPAKRYVGHPVLRHAKNASKSKLGLVPVSKPKKAATPTSPPLNVSSLLTYIFLNGTKTPAVLLPGELGPRPAPTFPKRAPAASVPMPKPKARPERIFAVAAASVLKDLKDAFEALLKQLFAIPAQIVQKIGAVVSPAKPTRARGGASKAKAKSAANGASKDKGRCGAKCGGRPAVAKRM